MRDKRLDTREVARKFKSVCGPAMPPEPQARKEAFGEYLDLLYVNGKVSLKVLFRSALKGV